MNMRILILAAMGLGAMYMMHLLAQDFNRIRRPLTNAVRSLIFKRDLTAQQEQHHAVMWGDAEINWNRILQNDPLNCALSLICEIAAGSEENNKEAHNIKSYVWYSIQKGIAPAKVESAFYLGIQKQSKSEHCYSHYPLCPYSAKTMLKILDIHAYIFGSG